MSRKFRFGTFNFITLFSRDIVCVKVVRAIISSAVRIHTVKWWIRWTVLTVVHKQPVWSSAEAQHVQSVSNERHNTTFRSNSQNKLLFSIGEMCWIFSSITVHQTTGSRKRGAGLYRWYREHCQYHGGKFTLRTEFKRAPPQLPSGYFDRWVKSRQPNKAFSFIELESKSISQG